MEVDSTEASCGVKQLSFLGSATGTVDMRNKIKKSEFFALLWGDSAVHGFEGFSDDKLDNGLPSGYTYLFSDNLKNGNGHRIADWIEEYKLGTLVKIGPELNPNTGRKIITWLWRYNGKKPSVAERQAANYKPPTKEDRPYRYW